jgi:hypothetical protein
VPEKIDSPNRKDACLLHDWIKQAETDAGEYCATLKLCASANTLPRRSCYPSNCQRMRLLLSRVVENPLLLRIDAVQPVNGFDVFIEQFVDHLTAGGFVAHLANDLADRIGEEALVACPFNPQP